MGHARSRGSQASAQSVRRCLGIAPRFRLQTARLSHPTGTFVHLAPRPMPVETIRPSSRSRWSTWRTMSLLMPRHSQSISDIANNIAGDCPSFPCRPHLNIAHRAVVRFCLSLLSRTRMHVVERLCHVAVKGTCLSDPHAALSGCRGQAQGGPGSCVRHAPRPLDRGIGGPGEY